MAIIIKTPKQIKGIKKSCELSANTLRYLEQFVMPGVSTQILNNRAEKYIRKHGGIPAPLGYGGYPKATCISLNEIICHGIPSNRVILKDGDILNIDISTELDGYYGDTCTMFKVGNTNDKANDLIAVARECLKIGIKQVKPGNKFGNIGHKIGRYAKSKGCSVVTRFCGHGVGIRLHEDPKILHNAKKNTGEVMKPGMIFAIEPMINEGTHLCRIDEDKWTARTLDGKLSAQFEHTVLVTQTGCEILTL